MKRSKDREFAEKHLAGLTSSKGRNRMKKKKIECQLCFDEEGSYGCVRPAHKKSAVIVIKGSDRDEVIDNALKQLKACSKLKEEHIDDGRGGWTEHYVKWDKKKARKILNALLDTLE